MPLVYRPARAPDLARADALVVATINDLTERHGFGTMASSRPPNFQAYCLKDDADGLWVAEENGEILGFAWSWVCGDLWFLAQLFVATDQQGRGIGQELLKRTLQHAERAGAVNKALITFTFNRVSQGLYIRNGMFPRFPIYIFSVARERLLPHLRSARLRCVPIENTPAHLQQLAEIDASALGVPRDKHHRYLIADGTNKGIMLYAGDERVGYAYISTDGHIGPLAVTQPDVMADAFTTALALAADSGAPQVSAFLPGTCDTALSLAVAHGMRITFPMLLMSSRGMADWTQYLPRNPGYM